MPRPKKPTPLITVKQAAERLGVHRDSIVKMIHRHELSAIDVSPTGGRRQWRIPESDVADFEARRAMTE